MGTVNVLEAARCSLGIRVFINVTSDKCYENEDSELGYRETDKLGGRDPYSVSKSCADLIGTAYYRSFLDSNRVALASVRAGNVIGGGDWADHRLVPDMIRAFSCGKRAHIRNPNSTRPWQHVLEPLSGYLALAQKLYSEGRSYAGSWNFGPAHTDVQSVAWLADKIATAWGDDANWGIDDSQYPYEAKTLKLDSSKSASHLEWRARWKLEQAILRTVDIYRSGQQSVNVREKCLKQIKEYQDLISQ